MWYIYLLIINQCFDGYNVSAVIDILNGAKRIRSFVFYYTRMFFTDPELSEICIWKVYSAKKMTCKFDYLESSCKMSTTQNI